jgi:uncharacterized protein with ATP-grasp and redox domains
LFISRQFICKKSVLKLAENKIEEAKQHKEKSIKYMEQAREVLNGKFPKNSVHSKRIENKLTLKPAGGKIRSSR